MRLLPLATEMGDWGLTIEGYTPPPNQGTPGDWQVVTPGYFETMGLTLREGRAFTAGDDMGAPLAMIVNRAFEQQYFAGRHALGGRVRINSRDTSTLVHDRRRRRTTCITTRSWARSSRSSTRPSRSSRPRRAARADR